MATFRFRCLNCSQPYNAKPEQAGRRFPCVNCGLKIKTPSPPSIFADYPIAKPAPKPNHAMSLVKCSAKKKRFAILLLKKESIGWVVTKAFKRSDDDSNQKRRIRRVKGKIHIAPDYLGCPYCGIRNLFKCGTCGTLNCCAFVFEMNDGQRVAICGKCNLGGFVGEDLNEIVGASEA